MADAGIPWWQQASAESAKQIAIGMMVRDDIDHELHGPVMRIYMGFGEWVVQVRPLKPGEPIGKPNTWPARNLKPVTLDEKDNG